MIVVFYHSDMFKLIDVLFVWDDLCQNIKH